VGAGRRSRRDAAIANSYIGAEAKRLLDGESPVRIWREKRGMTQRALTAAAAIPAGYLSEIESRGKPGSVAAYRALATALAVPMGDLVGDERCGGGGSSLAIGRPSASVDHGPRYCHCRT
jgi:hypothetical protein